MRRTTLIQQSFSRHIDGVGRRVAFGAGYQFLSIFLRTAVTIGSTAVLARLLSPADFGYVAMATVVTEFAALLGAFGLGNVLVQRRTINRLQMDTVFWTSLAVGAVLALVVVLLSLMTGLLFADAKVGELLRVLCLSFVLNSLAAIPSVVLSRLMRFRSAFWIQTCTMLVRAGAAIAAGLLGMGVWSLVIGALAGSLISPLLSFAVVHYRPRLRFHWPVLTASWRTSGGYLGNTLLHYVNSNLDLLLIGRGLGASSLGYYQNARSLTDEIRGRIAMPIQQVLFPAFSALQTDVARFQNLVLLAGRLLAAIVIPIGLGVSANAPELVWVLYGPNWLPMIPVMAVFGFSAALRASTAISLPLFNASNRVGLAFRYNMVSTGLLIGGVLLAMPYGIEAVSVAMAISSLYSLANLRAAFMLIGLGTRHVVRMLAPPATAAGMMWLATWGLRQLLQLPHPGAQLAFQVLLGAMVYLLVLHLLSRAYLEDVKTAAATLRGRSR
jgi:O-antigen/teichoic acid export membrane protein